jgi:hypothetical protein
MEIRESDLFGLDATVAHGTEKLEVVLLRSVSGRRTESGA